LPELLGQIVLDPCRDEKGALILRLLIPALDKIIGNGNLGDLPVLEIRLELAIGNPRNLVSSREKRLECRKKARKR
jgi:hypothetical protein